MLERLAKARHPHARADRAVPGLERRRAPRADGARAGAAAPAVATTAVVPVGLTRHRERLPDAAHADGRRGARARARRSRAGRREFLDTLGTPLRLGRATSSICRRAPRCPPPRAYEGFAIAEDGIGLVRRFEDGFAPRARRAPARAAGAPARVTVVTGEMFAPRLRRAARPRRAWTASRARRRRSPTSSSARGIGVAGLLTGQDIQTPARARAATSATRCSSPPWRCATAAGVFLDDLTPADLARRARRPRHARRARRRRALLRRPAGPVGPGRPAPHMLRPIIAIVGRPERRQVHALQPAHRPPALARARRARRHARPSLRHRSRSSAGRPPSSTPAASIPAERVRPHRGRAPAGAARRWTRPTSSCSWWTRARASPALDEEIARILRRSEPARGARGQQGGQRAARRPRSASSTGSASATGAPSPPSTGAAWPSCSRRCATARRAIERASPAPRRVRVADHRAAQRRQVVAGERDARRTSACSCTTRPAPRATRWTRPVDVPRPPVRARRHRGHPPQGQGERGAREALGGDGAQEPRAVPGGGARASTPPRA